MSIQSTEASYNQVPYPSYCFTQSHPDRLATIATLLGVQPTPIDQCRVLELGSASGGNLFPMAYGLPNSQFVGIDYAAGQVEEGQRFAAQLGLSNVELLHEDILTVDLEALGKFDYIIAHGVFSWVPQAVRERLMSLYEHCLASNGVGYISYNTLPGWHMLLAMREMMQFNTRDITDPVERVNKARHFVSELSEMVSEDMVFGAYVKTYEQLLSARGDGDESNALLLHDELETFNQPYYFHEFMKMADASGLQYLAEAEFPRVMLSNFKPENAKRLMELAGRDLIALEQNMDNVRFRTFRQTLLVHKKQSVTRGFNPTRELFNQFYVASRATPQSPDVDISPGIQVEFTAADSSKLSTDHPVSKAALAIICARTPQAISFEKVLQAAIRTVYAEPPPDEIVEKDARVLAINLLRGFSYSMNLIELHVSESDFVINVGDRPVASRYARQQVKNGVTKVANLRHERVTLDQFAQFALPHLDGTRTIDDVVALFAKEADDGMLLVQKDGHVLEDKEEQLATLKTDVARTIDWLASAALLER